MKNLLIYPILMIVVFIFSCSNDNSIEPIVDSTDPIINDSQSVTDCELPVTATVGICVDGTDFASPNEIITFASKLIPASNEASNNQFLWSIVDGNMEILDIENSIDGVFAKSVVTIKFNSDFSGGRIKVNAQNDFGGGIVTHSIDLE